MIFLYFLFGLVFGSFLNVLIYRWNTEKAPRFWQGRSFCPNCKHQLFWFDNIPLLSFLFLKGKCRYCKKKISWQYPVIELVTAVVTVLIGFNIFLFISYLFIVVFFSDLIYGLIPDETVIGLIIGAFLLDGFSNIFVGLGTGLLFYLLYKITKERGIGLGDVKLAFPLGLLLGWPKILAGMWVAFVVGGIWALFLLLLHRKKIHDTIVLGPFLIFGTIIALWLKDIPLLR